MSRSLKTPALATVAGSLLLAGSAFASTPLAQGYMLASADTPPKAKTAEAHCGADKGKAGEMKCGAGMKSGEMKCGADKAGEMKCGADKAGEMKCGAGMVKGAEMKCGANKPAPKAKPAPAAAKPAGAKMAEGKCGEGKCGGSI